MKQYSTEQLQESAQRTANVYAEIANRTMGSKLPIPVFLEFNLQNTTPKAAGCATTTMQVNINMILFEDNVDHILNDTIPHEIAHLVQFDKFNHRGADTQGHGIEWQEITRRFGKTPQKFHTLDTARSVEHFKTMKKTKKSTKGKA